MADLMNTFRQLALGFDPVFTALDQISRSSNNTPFPPYSIVQTDRNKLVLEMALAGYSKEDVGITVKDRILSIHSSKQEKEYQEHTEKEGNFIYKYPMIVHSGISYRSFTKEFPLGENMEIKLASFENGLLTIELEQEIPEEKKTKVIKIK